MQAKYVVGLAMLLACATSHAQYYGGVHRGSGYGGNFGSSGYGGNGYVTPRTPMPSYGTGPNWNSNGVSGYTRQNGTYVAPHQRSMPDASLNNNWSTKGNTNPYTGVRGGQRGNGFGW